MKKKYIFEVQFEYTVVANSYSEAVRLADKQLPDEDGKTTFVVNTMDYGFVPNQVTIKNMHEWGDYDDPNVVIVDFETGKVVDLWQLKNISNETTLKRKRDLYLKLHFKSMPTPQRQINNWGKK